MKTLMRLLPLVLIVAACDILTPKPVCGCTPLGGGSAVVTGIVRNSSDALAPGALVTMQVLQDAPCQNVTPSATITTIVTAGADGRFRQPTAWGGGNKCFRLFARPAGSPAGVTSDTHIVNIEFRYEGAVPDSVELLLRLK